LAVEIQSVMHVNVNCRILDRSLAFYRDVAGLVPESHTNPVPQDGAGFGLEGRVQWDAHILHDERGFAGPGLDLLEWKIPKPVGVPADAPNHLGFFRVGLRVPDIDAVYERALARGVACASPPVEARVDSADGSRVRALLCRDPDGTAVEFVEAPGLAWPRLSHVNVNCSNLEVSRAWYERVLGLEVRGGSSPGPVGGAFFGLEEDVEWQADRLWPKGQDAFAIDLLEWKHPAPAGRPAAAANQLGLYRMAFMVEDMQACYAELQAQGVECPPPVYLDMGPEIPIDGLWAVFFPDPDGACMELIETPRL